jgi:hypothetical protein
MNQGSGSGGTSPASVTASADSVVTNHQIRLGTENAPRVSIRRDKDYPVADLFGRCFLRVCYWVEVFSSMTRREDPLSYEPFPRRPVASLSSAKHLVEKEAPAASGTPLASA